MPFYLQLHHAFYPYISIARIRLMNQITTLHSFNLDDSVSWTTNFLIGITTCNKQLSSLIQPILTPSNKTHSPLFHYSSFQFNANNQRQPSFSALKTHAASTKPLTSTHKPIPTISACGKQQLHSLSFSIIITLFTTPLHQCFFSRRALSL